MVLSIIFITYSLCFLNIIMYLFSLLILHVVHVKSNFDIFRVLCATIGNIRICEYKLWWRHIREFLDLVNMKEYVKNMKEYVENMKEYVDILDLTLPYLYGPWDLEKFWASPHLGSGTWKNSELCLFIGSGILKNFEFPPPSITACCKLSLLCKPQTLLVNLQLATSPNTSREHLTRKLIVVDVFPPSI